MLEIVYLEPNNKYKDILFIFNLWGQVIGSFIVSVFVGMKLDHYFNTKPIIMLLFLLLAFVYIMKLLLGVGKDE